MAKAVINALNLAHHKEFAANDQKKGVVASIADFTKGIFSSLISVFYVSSSDIGDTGDIKEAGALTPEEIREQHEESKLIDAFLDKLEIEPIRNSHLVNLSFLAHDPALAARVVNTLAEQYIKHNLKLKYEASMDASQWLNQNVGDLKKKMETSEEALHSYKDENKIVSLEEKQDIIVQKLSEISTAVTDCQNKEDTSGDPL